MTSLVVEFTHFKRCWWLLCQFANADVAEQEIVWFAVVLKPNITLQRTVLHGSLIQSSINNLFAIQIDLEMAANTGQDHSIPFMRRP